MPDILDPPDLFDAYVNLGMAWWLAGDNLEACGAVEKARPLASNSEQRESLGAFSEKVRCS